MARYPLQPCLRRPRLLRGPMAQNLPGGFRRRAASEGQAVAIKFSSRSDPTMKAVRILLYKVVNGRAHPEDRQISIGQIRDLFLLTRIKLKLGMELQVGHGAETGGCAVRISRLEISAWLLGNGDDGLCDGISLYLFATRWKSTKWLGGESNSRHEDFQSSALPTELPSRLTGSGQYGSPVPRRKRKIGRGHHPSLWCSDLARLGQCRPGRLRRRDIQRSVRSDGNRPDSLRSSHTLRLRCPQTW